jgi:hypothetical protein
MLTLEEEVTLVDCAVTLLANALTTHNKPMNFILHLLS